MKGGKFLERVKRDIRDAFETVRVGESLQQKEGEGRERENWGLSGLQGPNHYWRWQFCPAAGTDSCGTLSVQPC